MPIKVVGWAVRDRAQLQWTDNSVDIYVNDIRENAPQCAEPLRPLLRPNGDYRSCPGGVARHYDQSLWLTAGIGGGAGGDWGQRMGSEYFMSNLNADNVHDPAARDRTHVRAGRLLRLDADRRQRLHHEGGQLQRRSPSSTSGCSATGGAT